MTKITRSFSNILPALSHWGPYWWGDLYWIRDGSPLGSEVRRFHDPARLRAYATLLEEMFIWAHMDPRAWHVLIVEPPHEVGEDFVMVRRYPGVAIDQFFPEHTDDPVEAPVKELELLAETVARLRAEAVTARDQFFADLIVRRHASLDSRLVYDGNDNEHRFHLWDLDPDEGELATWMALSS